jgi:transcription antitermination factor NusG
MERNWYAIYTKPNKEGKVVTALTKKGIKNYCPLTSKFNPSKHTQEQYPLFASYVFVYITGAEIATVKNIPYVSNFIFYKSQPVVINRREIGLVKKITTTYINIKLEKTSVNMDEMAGIDTVPALKYDTDDVMIVNIQTVKVYLPSLGYLLTADADPVNNAQLNRGFGLRNFIPGNFKNFRAN